MKPVSRTKYSAALPYIRPALTWFPPSIRWSCGPRELPSSNCLYFPCIFSFVVPAVVLSVVGLRNPGMHEHQQVQQKHYFNGDDEEEEACDDKWLRIKLG